MHDISSPNFTDGGAGTHSILDYYYPVAVATDMCKQGSAVWHDLRQNSIGGSSASIMLNLSKYKTLDTFIYERASGHENHISNTDGLINEDLNWQIPSSILGMPITTAVVG